MGALIQISARLSRRRGSFFALRNSALAVVLFGCGQGIRPFAVPGSLLTVCSTVERKIE
jgi:hypothetical protein